MVHVYLLKTDRLISYPICVVCDHFMSTVLCVCDHLMAENNENIMYFAKSTPVFPLTAVDTDVGAEGRDDNQDIALSLMC